MFQNYLVQTPIDSVNSQNIFEGRTKIFTLLCGPRIGFYKVIKLYRTWNTGPIVQSMTEWGNKEGRQVIWQQSPIHRISLICVHLYCLESGKEAHLQSSKTNRGSYLDPELNIFVKIFEFYLVTHPFKKDFLTEFWKFMTKI